MSFHICPMSLRIFLSMCIIICLVIHSLDQSTVPCHQITDMTVIKWQKTRISKFRDQILNDPYLQGLKHIKAFIFFI